MFDQLIEIVTGTDDLFSQNARLLFILIVLSFAQYLFLFGILFRMTKNDDQPITSAPPNNSTGHIATVFRG